MTHSTETPAAQRRLLEALATLGRRPNGLPGLCVGMPFAIAVAIENDMPDLAAVWQAVGELAAAVEADQREEQHHG